MHGVNLQVSTDAQGKVTSLKCLINDGITHYASQEAAQIYNNAKNSIVTGEFTIYYLEYGDYQKLLLLETAENKPEVNLTINKTDAVTNKALPGVKFKIELTNVESIDNYQIPTSGEQQNPPIVVYVTTDSKGQVNLTGIVPKTFGTSITAKVTEVGVPTADGYYYKEISPFTVTLTYNNGSYLVSGQGASISGNKVTVNVKNDPLINLSGNVWQDAQIGDKDISEANGIKDNAERNIEGVLVELYSVKSGKIVRTTVTDSSGNYSFQNIGKTKEGYIIIFKYDGINYEATTKDVGNDDKIDSDAEEKDRDIFNNRFKTISKGQSNDGTTLTYTPGDGISTLNVDIAGNTTGTTDAKFQMKAQTGTYTTTSNVDCGLVKKEVDLSLGTDVKSAELKINEKSMTYEYAQIINGEVNLDEVLDKISSENQNVTYNLYLYKSDYNYRIEDYKTDNGAISNKVNPSDNGVNNYDNLAELEAYVTYNVVLKNQTPFYGATVDEFVYYYDEIYTPYNITSTDKYNVSIDEASRKITFTSKDGGLAVNRNNDYRVNIDLTFKVNKNSDSYIILKENCTNIAEITKYSTDKGGLIDRDSAPGNAIINNGLQYEDDTDKSKGLNIAIDPNKTRAITGTVFEDANKNGNLDDNKPVNDVIVQLIEIKKISGQYYEYIWQETRSGSNTVKKLNNDGSSIIEEKYRENVPSDGSYQFTEFIPGNYIIRFIYGDGSTYDLTDNVKTYNGQDYKSTIDSKYNAEWYNTAGYTAGESVARDNEARRLEVMAYSSTIDEDIGKALEEKTTLDRTWMAAETSRLNVPVDGEVSFGDINFGLELRPQTKLVLEKHITGLKITPSGTGVQSIVDAKADIEDIVNGETVEISGVVDGLTVIYSDSIERGFWKVGTDVEELAQGAQLEVEYTYVIRNNGEKDYLSKTLVEAYENQDAKVYNQVLTEIKDTVKETMRKGTYSYKTTGNNDKLDIGEYLGKYYYTGDVGENDAEVTSRVETFEEAINNDLAYVAETSGTDFTKVNNTTVEKPIYDTDGNLKTEAIDTIVNNSKATKFLTTGTADYSKTITLTTTLAASSGGQLGANIPGYIAQITEYSNAAGRRDMNAEPANLRYVHSNDSTKTIKDNNEHDEFWAETVKIGQPEGEDKLSPLQITLIAISATAALVVGIILIKKFVLKNNT